MYHLQNNNMIKYKLTEKYQFLDTFEYPKSIVIIEIKCTRISIKLKIYFDVSLFWLCPLADFIKFIHSHFMFNVYLSTFCIRINVWILIKCEIYTDICISIINFFLCHFMLNRNATNNFDTYQFPSNSFNTWIFNIKSSIFGFH